MPAATQIQLDDMTRLLQSGPVLIGEDHTLGHARLAIYELIKRGAVQFLSIESPIGPSCMVRADGQLLPQRTADYFEGATPMHNPTMSMQTLVGYAMEQNVSVYCHDVPLAKSPLNFFARIGDDYSVYPTQAKQYLPDSMPALPTTTGSAANKFVARNMYSATYLKTHLGAGVRVLWNLVILAGASHVDVQQCGQARTLQARLGIADTRVFRLD
ncbi:hypothetical protein [Niveibacterium microcysteis]|uniref:Class II aldolase/adducin N-terminal domain-containing protein n=1 Tax=Niveibacterium microcysteis TaxID=2811415 RepID=A0ABX7M4Y6_9RHOO|nr:hypothetical protein [Niveibacterium microcysteis]QSI76824.1 hypothetical protein JY500_20635 [Niveibacterium microcysteis]